MNSHITKLCQTLNYLLRNLFHIRSLLDDDSAKLIVNALITSRIDYCNSLLYGLPAKTLNRLQLVQNRAARLITKVKRTDHITPVLQSLHWLPVAKRVDYKIACLAFKCIQGDAPYYLKELLNVYSPARNLRSANSVSLERKVPKNKFTERSFAFSAPAVWNSLPARTRNCQTFSAFKKYLKTDLFCSAFE